MRIRKESNIFNSANQQNLKMSKSKRKEQTTLELTWEKAPIEPPERVNTSQ
jgi:hypothetical protein